jgi:GNAT superfamily N-acetyltransferase
MKQNKIMIQVAKRKDINNCLRLALERDANINKRKRPEYWKKLLNSLIGSKRLVVASLDQELIGFCYFSPFLYEDNHNMYVQLIYVQERHRKKGVATALFDEIKKIAKNKGGTKLFSASA